MTRVLAFCDYLQEPMGGGAEIVSAEVYERLAANGWSITVLTGIPGRPGGGAPAGPAVEVRTRRGLDLSKVLGAQLSIAPGVILDAWRSIRRERPDVIHASSIHFFGSIVAAVASRLSGIPLVTTCHLSGLEALPPRTRRVAALYEKTVGRFILRRSSRVIAVSRAVRDHVVAVGADVERVHVVENGVDSHRFAPGERDDFRTVVAFVGRLIDNKGPLGLVDALAQTTEPGITLRIVGDGPLRQEIEARAAADARIEVMGHRDDVEAILAAADVFVRPSTTEGRSLAILEAMAAGCAVVATDIPANAEMIDHGSTGMLVPCEDVAALAAALDRLAADAPLRRRLGAAAREVALTSSWDATSDETGAILAMAGG